MRYFTFSGGPVYGCVSFTGIVPPRIILTMPNGDCHLYVVEKIGNESVYKHQSAKTPQQIIESKQEKDATKKGPVTRLLDYVLHRS